MLCIEYPDIIREVYMTEWTGLPVPITKNQGRDYNFFQKVSVNWAAFGGGQTDGYSPDAVITFSTQGFQFINLGSGGTNVVEYSFNGNTVHGELNPTTGSVNLLFDNRVASLIWFRLQAGSSGPVVISIQAWGIR
jgi:hypothetical protein